jgi:hypothetical protein
MAPELFGTDRAALLKKHLQAQLNVEFFTIPFYLTAVYSFTEAATSYAGPNKDYPLYNMQQTVLSVAAQEMYHLQEACNLANAYNTLPVIEEAARNFPTGKIVVPHLDPGGDALTAELGNLPAVIAAMVAVEKPDPDHTFPAPNDKVQYPAISDLYHATLTLIAEYMNKYRLMPMELDPHFTPNEKQVAYGAFAARYIYNKIAHREDFLQAANAIADQGEGREVAPKGTGLFQSGEDDKIAEAYLPTKGSRFYNYDLVTHYARFVKIQNQLMGISEYTKLIGGPVFYEPGVVSPDLPKWAPSYDVCQQSVNTIWSYFTDVMVSGFRDGSLAPGSGGAIDFGSMMMSFKYTLPLIWQHGKCPTFAYTPGVTVEQALDAMDAVDPLCLYHWDKPTTQVRASFPKNACQGLNACKGQGWGGIATKPGEGACATADFHSCQGGNSCHLQGGCGFLSSDPTTKKLLPGSDQWIPGINTGESSGGCQTPIATLQVFNSAAEITDVQPPDTQQRLTGLKGTSVWEEARSLFSKKIQVNPLPTPITGKVGALTYDGTERRTAVSPSSKS